MLTFLEETLQAIQKESQDISSALLILPSKRAGGFLKNYMRKHASQTHFLPEIISIEEFIEKLSDLSIIDNTELLFLSYQAYLKTDSISEKDDFETFSSWITTLLNDLNEMDRYLVPQNQFFGYLSGIQDINHWYLKHDKTELIENYLNFWNSLPGFYDNLSEILLNNNVAYQGLAYRKAAEDIEHYLAHHGDREHIFIGFNALNGAEQQIIQELLENGNGKTYWDADTFFMNDEAHSASLFLRSYTKEWKYFQGQAPLGIGNHFGQPKTFRFVETQNNMAQAKYLTELLKDLSEDELSGTAIVLADEAMLHPVLNSLPKNVTRANVTMGASLRQFPATVFFELLLNVHRRQNETIYYKDVLTLLNHPLLSSLISQPEKILLQIADRNITHLSIDTLCELTPDEDEAVLRLVFGNWNNNSSTAIKNCRGLITMLDGKARGIQKTVLHQLDDIFSSIEVLNDRFSHLETVQMVKVLFSELLAGANLDFEGDAYDGLQIMGVLESRVLDFENVILLSVNEGILPSGKTEASFITYDLKQTFGLPLYTDKDAIYAYHFYRLLHRAQNITCMYNTRADGLKSGEKSRFLTQLEVESHPNHTIKKVLLSPEISVAPIPLVSVSKTPGVMERLKEIAGNGFSPSALTMYIRNPLDFYYRRILKIDESEEVEETVAANTMGSIVHDALQSFYEPLEGSFLTSEVLTAMLPRIEEEAVLQFKKTFKSGNFRRGKNLIIFEVTKRYITNLIKHDLAQLKQGHRIKILKIERELIVPVPIPELDFPVRIGGTVDRLDEFDGQLRIIDYKTGLVRQAQMEITAWDQIISDFKYSKAFQVLAYAEMIHPEIPVENALTGVISFKNLNSGFLKFGVKETPMSRKKQQELTPDIRSNFLEQLKTLILEICNPDIPFTEKEV